MSNIPKSLPAGWLSLEVLGTSDEEIPKVIHVNKDVCPLHAKMILDVFVKV